MKNMLILAAVFAVTTVHAKQAFNTTVDGKAVNISKLDAEHIEANVNGTKLVLNKLQARALSKAFSVGSSMLKAPNTTEMQAEIKKVRDRYQNRGEE